MHSNHVFLNSGLRGQGKSYNLLNSKSEKILTVIPINMAKDFVSLMSFILMPCIRDKINKRFDIISHLFLLLNLNGSFVGVFQCCSVGWSKVDGDSDNIRTDSAMAACIRATFQSLIRAAMYSSLFLLPQNGFIIIVYWWSNLGIILPDFKQIS